jgi:hypothetical protein
LEQMYRKERIIEAVGHVVIVPQWKIDWFLYFKHY